MANANGLRTADFWAAAGERGIATFAQTLVALIGLDTVTPLWGMDWPYYLGAAATAAVLSVLKSVGAGAVTGTPSIGHLEDPALPKSDKLKQQGYEQGI